MASVDTNETKDDFRQEVADEFRGLGILAEGDEEQAADQPTEQPTDTDQLAAGQSDGMEGEEPVDDWRTDLINRIRAAELDVARAESFWKGMKEEAKEAKADFDRKVSILRRLIQESREDLPLFDGGKSSTADDVTNFDPAAEGESSQADTTDTATPTAIPPDDDSWREIGLEDLSLTESLLTKLYSANLDTVGELADFTASGKQLVDIDGVGPAAAEKIEGAMDRFWLEWGKKDSQ